MNTGTRFKKVFKSVGNRLVQGAGSRLAQKLAIATPVMENADPTQWREHRFGLTPERWESLRGKSFWITGAGTGYGRCLACALAAAGAQVFLTGRRREKLEESIAEMKTLEIPTENCFVIPADLSQPEQILRACEEVRGLCQGLDGLVNSAALPSNPGVAKPLQDDSLEYWNQTMRVNVTAPWLLTRTIFPHLRSSGQVKVLFITSSAGWASTPRTGIYNISKAALNSLAHSLAEEYVHSFPGEDIQMNALDPGVARTEMNRASNESPYAVVSLALLLLSHPAGGPNGKFFCRDGRHLTFGYTGPYEKPLI